MINIAAQQSQNTMSEDGDSVDGLLLCASVVVSEA